MTNIFLILIGINIGAIFGWLASKKFRGDMEELMKWFNEAFEY